jgi:hypothetical protein
MSERRKFLRLAGAATATALAGCSGGGSTGGSQSTPTEQPDTPTERPDRDGDGVPDVNDDFPRNSNLSSVLESVDDTRNIEEDEWYWYELELTESGQLAYDFIVREGPPTDLIVVAASEYEYFEEGERYEYVAGPTVFDSAGSEGGGRLSAGNYRLIFDNTSRGEAAPPANMSNDVVEVEFEFTLAV